MLTGIFLSKVLISLLTFYTILNSIYFLSTAVNVVAIVILSREKCGLSRCITLYLVAMAMGDLMVVIFDVIFYRIGYLYFPDSFLNRTPVCRANIVLFTVSTDCSVWFTVAFTFDRFVAICCQKLRKRYCCEKTAARVLGALLSVNCLKSTVIHFIFGPHYQVNNMSWGCVLTPGFYSSLGWKVYMFIFYIWNPALPFLLILLCNALTVRYILVASLINRKSPTLFLNFSENFREMAKSCEHMVIPLLDLGASPQFTICFSICLLQQCYFQAMTFNPHSSHEPALLSLTSVTSPDFATTSPSGH
uniref:G-protein coupled receptors family 1 profile domain-containing protein n=1 Tax=Callorhinchus milii TaxID=7868 RepID=A0A4W3GUW7_CALMI